MRLAIQSFNRAPHLTWMLILYEPGADVRGGLADAKSAGVLGAMCKCAGGCLFHVESESLRNDEIVKMVLRWRLTRTWCELAIVPLGSPVQY